MCNSQEATGDKQQRKNYSSRPRQQQHSRHSNPQQIRYVDSETPCDATQDTSEWGIFTVQSTTQPSIKVELKVNNAEVVMELDTGAPSPYVRENITTQIATSGITAICCYTQDILRGAIESAWTGTS